VVGVVEVRYHGRARGAEARGAGVLGEVEGSLWEWEGVALLRLHLVVVAMEGGVGVGGRGLLGLEWVVGGA